MGEGPSRAERLISLCATRGWTLGTAESLTGGLVAAALIDVPGASAVVRGGVVAYATDVKQEVLAVSRQILEVEGTVSSSCAVAMAAGAWRLLGATFAISTTGVAGPDASEGKSPGTVHLAVYGRAEDGEEVQVHRALHLHGDRSIVRNEATAAGLSLLLDTLTNVVPAAAEEHGEVRYNPR